MRSELKSDVVALWEEAKNVLNAAMEKVSSTRNRIAQVREREPETNVGLKHLDDGLERTISVMGSFLIAIDDNQDALIELMDNEASDTITEPNGLHVVKDNSPETDVRD